MLAAAAGFRPRYQPRLPWTIFAAMALGGELRGLIRGREPYPSLGHARLNWYSWFASSERAREELGFVPRPLAVSLAETYAWYAGRERFNVRGFNQWLMRPGKGVRSAI